MSWKLTLTLHCSLELQAPYPKDGMVRTSNLGVPEVAANAMPCVFETLGLAALQNHCQVEQVGWLKNPHMSATGDP